MGNFNRGRDNRNRDRRGGGFGRRDSGRSFNRSGDRQMHKVICDDCHKECEVPFKPSNDKPIYCNECFSKHGGGKSNERRGDNRPSFSKESSKSHEEIMKAIKDLNYKIDELTKLFNSKTSDNKETVVKKKVTKTTTAAKKKTATKKKTTKKKK